MASEAKSLTMQEATVCAWTVTSVLLKISFGGTGVEMARKKVTLDHGGKAIQLHFLWKPKRRRHPITKEIDQHQCRYMARIASVVVQSRRVQGQMCILKTSQKTKEMP